ncbi:hypothetical protein FHS29_001297 [Saccharothrix tamanrassetensis]|uniref:Uncharacterized protein n=1 Tax=Saccharothrix tamanrassetensis TaxID=1051531 RepID=A0A841CEZ4_9PSEU|nr:hypothetical protein [Saccharothrix tamanrassetensis]MBB5954727.1 hypothetical protein [Saccharothrix tamanrassetensis]
MTTPQDPDGRQQQPYIPPPPPLSESELQGSPAAGDRHVPVPKEVQASFWIWIAGAVLSVVGALLALTQREEIARALRDSPQSGQLSPAEFDAAVTFSLLFAVAIGVVFAGLYVLFAFKARAGRNWARVVLTVLTALGLLSLLFGPSLFGVVTSLLSVVAVVLLYMPNSKAYFDAVKRAG